MNWLMTIRQIRFRPVMMKWIMNITALPLKPEKAQAAPEQLGRPVETKQDRRYAGEGSSLLHKLLTDVTDKIAGNAPNTEK